MATKLVTPTATGSRLGHLVIITTAIGAALIHSMMDAQVMAKIRLVSVALWL